jgi:UDP-sugar transporter A1/2/3
MTIFFEKSLSWAKWRALILLVMGCVLVASPVYHRDAVLSASSSSLPSTTGGGVSQSVLHSLIGITVVLVMVANSGFGSVYLESVLKKEKQTVWDRNFQLSFLSSLLIGGIILTERMSNNELLFHPLFEGFTINAYLLAIIQALGGILVAAALKYADSILKTLATCLAIVVTAVVENIFLGVPADIFVIIGCFATILAIANYSFDQGATES